MFSLYCARYHRFVYIEGLLTQGLSDLKVPEEIKTYCPRCNAHTPHSVSVYRAGRARTLAAGQRHHERVDRHGYGGSKAPMQKRKVKTTKKQALKLKCRKCGFVIQKEGIRLRKLEIAA
jgi:large subunit ribosomal protein L44e